MQDLQISARAVHYRRERWLTPAGVMIVAPLPGGIGGHFGSELRRFVLMQYHQGQVTVERLVTLLQAVGISISKRLVMSLLINQQDDFLSKTKAVLRAGLQSAGWITVDDTGARHRGANAVCTQIGYDNFAWFGTTCENDIRCQVTKRAVSGGTHSDTGRDCRDAFLGLAKTCRKLGVAFWDYLGARIGVAGAPAVAPLSDLMRSRAQAARAG